MLGPDSALAPIIAAAIVSLALGDDERVSADSALRDAIGIFVGIAGGQVNLTATLFGLGSLAVIVVLS